MRHVLIVEDNVLKEARIRDVLSLIPEIEFTVCRSVKAAYPLLEVQQWNLILLDMSFQVSPDSGTEIKKKPLAGRQILQFMRARNLMLPVIVVTQHASFSEGQTVIASIKDLDTLSKPNCPRFETPISKELNVIVGSAGPLNAIHNRLVLILKTSRN